MKSFVMPSSFLGFITAHRIDLAANRAPLQTLPSPIANGVILSPETSTRLSTPEFFTRVHSLTPQIAAFDCDGTLWSGDAGSGFMRWTIDTGLISAKQIAGLNAHYDAYNRGEVSEAAICGEMVQVYCGLSVERMRHAAAEFFRDHIEPHIFPEMLTLVRQLQQNNVEIWAVSSTCDWVIEEGVRRFNIPPDRVLATRVSSDNGIVSDRILDVPTGEAKVAALHRAGVNAPDAVFGNSIHDAAMLALARRAFPVNPSPALLERSIAEGWPVYYPASVTPLPE